MQPVDAPAGSIRHIVSPEARVLLYAIGATTDRAGLRRTLTHPDFAWDRLFDLAIREKAAPALHELLAGLSADLVPAEPRSRLSALLRLTHVRMLRLEQLFLQAVDTLQAQDVDAVLLKGAGLATTVYGSFGARPMYDVDLLVRPDDALRAWNALRANGWVHDEIERPAEFYTTHYHLPPLDDPLRSGLAVELHTSLTDGAIEIDSEMIRREAREIRVRGRRVLVPAVEHQVLHLATHFAWTHGMASAGWRTFHDLHQLITNTSVDWERVVAIAQETRATTSCYWTFRLAQSLAGVSTPGPVLERLRPPRPEAVLRVLERHYAGVLFFGSQVHCPSVRVTQMLWSAGMAPRWSGHGSTRPWERGEVWSDTRGMAAHDSLLTRLRGHAHRLAHWRRYLGTLVR
ncbi:MAG TPA: nucleotidyltransferase family protein [Longimicrobiales bacterium]|nr:nucleotidyltransferase family protein [Longimicrobiales bacterium]